MLTGDAPLTSLHVARATHIIDRSKSVAILNSGSDNTNNVEPYWEIETIIASETEPGKTHSVTSTKPFSIKHEELMVCNYAL